MRNRVILVVVVAAAVVLVTPQSGFATDTTVKATFSKALRVLAADRVRLLKARNDPLAASVAAANLRANATLYRVLIAADAASTTKGSLGRSLGLQGLTALRKAMDAQIKYQKALIAGGTGAAQSADFVSWAIQSGRLLGAAQQVFRRS